MKLKLVRKEFFDTATRGELWIDGNFECYTLEDKDRGLTKDMPLHVIESIKIKHETAIPYGSYKIAMTLSMRFKKLMPELLGVPGFDGIRIHPGNTAEDTSGCVLVGTHKDSNDGILNSRDAYENLLALIAIGGEHEIEITKEKT